MSQHRTDGSDGGPAYPVCAPPDYQFVYLGMSMRDHMAAAALPQAVLDYGEPGINTTSGQRWDRGNPILPYASAGSGTREAIIARQAYKYADAMIAARDA